MDQDILLKYSDDFIKQIEQEKIDFGVSSFKEESLIYNFYVFLEMINKDNNLKLEKIKMGGKILEIGGPSPKPSHEDALYCGASEMLTINKDISVGKLYAGMLEKLEKKKNFDFRFIPFSIEKFSNEYSDYSGDIITSYNVFGSENQIDGFAHEDLGPGVETKEKRNNILKKINSLLKINGLFLNKTMFENGLCFSDEELEEAGFIILDQMNSNMYAAQKKENV